MRTKDLSRHWVQYQPLLFENKDSEFFCTEPLQKLLIVLDTIDPGRFVEIQKESVRGRPRIDRVAMLRVFIAKSVLNISENKFILERLKVDYTLRRICGFSTVKSLPCEASMSNIFKEFSQKGLCEKIHYMTIDRYLSDTLLEHASRDATAIPARERTTNKRETVDKSSLNTTSKAKLESLFDRNCDGSINSTSLVQRSTPSANSSRKDDPVGE